MAAGARGTQGGQGEAAAVTQESNGGAQKQVSRVGGETSWDCGDLDDKAW